MSTDPTLLAVLPPEYLNEDKSAPLFNTAIAFIVVQTVFVVLFYISRYINKTANGIEFWCFMPLAYIFSIGLCVVAGLLIVKKGGSGRHIAAVMLEDPDAFIVWLKLHYIIGGFIYLPSIIFSKLTILTLYMRIFTTRPYRIATYLTGVFLILMGLAGIITSVSICRPYSYFWDKTAPGGKCGDVIAAWRYFSVPNLLSDAVMLVLPLPVLYKLKVDVSVKICLALTFTMGGMGIIGGVLRLVSFFTNDIFADPTFNSVETSRWTIVEPSLYLIAACMPSLRPLKRKLFPQLSIASLVSTVLTKASGKLSRHSSGKSRAKIYRTTELDVKSAKADRTEKSSMDSSSGLRPQTQIYVEMGDWKTDGQGGVRCVRQDV